MSGGVNEIRSTFLDYFKKSGHEIVASSPLVPRNDPTLMFTNAGMVQFKNVFTGNEKRPYTRASTAQKCVRAGGKHNDLDNVGYTARHHTFFEMLGNFSFGDYFKEEAIALAWTLITKEFCLPIDRLLVTVYHTDDKAFDLWKKIAGFSESKIIRIPTNDNFWAMGDTGPCGPCSEIFYDQGEALFGGPPGSADEDGDRFLEFWNLVFMQFDQAKGGERLALPRPSIDTGMGLERIAALLQGKTSNYDIDLMRALILAVSAATGVDPDGPRKASHRVIADHLRACAFLVADGVLPSNEGRGYVLRRIMRRAMRHAQLLGAAEPLMWRLVPALTHEMGQAYPELLRAEALIIETFRLEETRFRTTLARGLSILEDETLGFAAGATVSGDTAFKLYDTYGFPLDLTQDALRERNLGVDVEGFEKAMERQRADARKAWTGSGEAATDTIWFGLKERVGATEFLGYETEKAEGIVTAIIKDGQETASLKTGESGLILLNQTPFYGESGGQVGDTGFMLAPSVSVKITNTQKKLGDLFVHEATVEAGEVTPGLALDLLVDHARRAAVRANHSATHLLHEALRLVLGDHVAQKGSLVAPDRLRFDFAHPKPISAEELTRVEEIANAAILQNAPVSTRLMSQDAAIESGARALFGEKYGDEVRVVSMGYAIDRDDFESNRFKIMNVIDSHKLEQDAGGNPLHTFRHPPQEPEAAHSSFSVELCGGTHVARTGDIGLLSIVSEGAVAAGVRRIEAKTATEARHHLNTQAHRLRAVATLLKAPEDELDQRLANLIEERRKLERELSDVRRKLAMGGGEAGSPTAEDIDGVKFLRKTIAGIDMKDLKPLADDAKQSVGSGVVAIIGIMPDGKAGVVVGVTSDLTARFDAVALVQVASVALGGKGGGGRRDLAQAGGPNGAAAEAALDAIGHALHEKANAA